MKDFKVERGLRQEYPIFPFLFVIVVEGLSKLFIIASIIGDFEGFSVHEGLSVDLIQFMDDTLIIEFGCWNNLWIIKVILRGFKLIYGLGVNFTRVG